MSERLRKLVDGVVETVKKPLFIEVVAVLAVVGSALVLSGIVYGLFSGVVIGVAFFENVIRVFYPDQRVQTVAELLVTSTFYLLGFAGFLLYTFAFSRRFSPRSSRYMLVFSGLLIALAALGLIGGFLSKA
ncbi:MAG: hypothetical protein N3H84_05300 [Candidatus Caldarchaeum sp.]|nr:hypothetical protein [Candidatus Caldarchaeum sp.]MCX8201503.1 hypothetical protein [Candidatus Caldarchaeum sp.]MDW8435143.1 hypothetical protein [Candidatus Caldarchaeum sp.]